MSELFEIFWQLMLICVGSHGEIRPFEKNPSKANQPEIDMTNGKKDQ
jgi:hypothetical protein